MLTVYNCIVHDHDLRLVMLAGLICAISAFAAVQLLKHIGRASGRVRFAWTALAAASTGFGIWATHFVAMLAFAPDLPTAYDIPLTGLSLVLAVAITGLGIAIATWRDTLDHHLVGGAVIGGGIAAMHFVGMAAFEVEGVLVWNQLYVAAALVAGVGLGALAIRLALTDITPRGNVVGAIVLTLGICALHFVAMAAVSIRADAAVELSKTAVAPGLLAVAVSAAAFSILLFASVALWVDLRDIRRAGEEEERMRGLADAAVEGLVVCRDGIVVTANASFLALAGSVKVVGRPFAELVRVVPAPEGESVEGTVIHADGRRLPAEIIARAIDYRGEPHTIHAIRDLSERKQAEADIRHLALHDTLTGLPNRRAFNDRLAREIAAHQGQSGRHLALLCLDLDRFKEVNDLFGHAAGDAMLQRVAQCTGAVLVEGQMIARLGGDEFAILAPDLASPAEAARIAEAVLGAFREENRRASSDGLMSTSIGIALSPMDATEAEALVTHADTALYRAKSEGGDTYRFFEKSMGQEVRSRRIMEFELRHAVSRGELSLAYQPQKKLDTGETIGFEALLRWAHPQRGNVSPAIFVPVAEESGAIVQIGEWVMEQACRDAADWDDRLTVAVNVSAVQLHSPDFPRTVHAILMKSGLAPRRLEIEITETALVRDMNRALATLRQLKALGVRVAMDDFGTGYSSLSNLRAFPFDKIKIDGSFIRSVDTNEQAATIVKAVLGIGRGLGLPVLAEGVETSEELKFLAGEFCQIGQGYLLGRPAPIDTFGEVTAEEQQAARDEAA